MDMMLRSITAPLANDGNGLLAALSDHAHALIEPHLRHCEFDKGALLWSAGEPTGHVYFPNSGLISITLPSPDGYRIEVGSVSREGVAGIRGVFDNTSVLTSAIVQIGGQFAAIAERPFADAVRQSEELAALAAFGCEWLLLQAQLMAACNATHTADARFCRWLLLASERTGSDMIPVTQEEMAGLLGIRRTTVTLIAQKLQAAGAIDYSRGKLFIRDRQALEPAACPCCATYDRQHWPATRLQARDLPAAAQRVSVD
jgi:CRP-like cAMP-binding protein